MGKPKTVYYADTEALRPVPTTIEPRGDRDEAGRTVYENTHFRTEREAWERLIAEATAGVKLGGSAVERQRSILAEAETQLVKDALDLKTVLDGFERWEVDRG